MSLAETFLIISIQYMSMSYYFYLWAKKYNKIGQIMKLWPLGFFFICCSAYFLSFISYPQFHFRQILSISLVFLWSLIVFIQINRRLKRKQEMQREQEKGLGSILRMNLFQMVVAAPILSIHFMPGASWITLADLFGFALALVGIYIQYISNMELLKNEKNILICNGKLRSFCRYPNALGEVIFWLSIYMLAIGSVNGYMSIYGPLVLIIILLKIILPKEDTRLENKYNQFKDYKSSSWILFPKLK